MDDRRSTIDDPLPIWFFVGLILTVYGVLVVGAGALSEPAPRVVQVTDMAPGLWWGGIMTLCGLVFLAIGILARRARDD